VSKKQGPARFGSSKGKKSKKKPYTQRHIPSQVDLVVGVAPPVQASEVPRPVTAPPSVLRKPVQKAWTPPRASRGQPRLSTDYSYVSNDLRRIAITAAAMFVIIGGLSLVVR